MGLPERAAIIVKAEGSVVCRDLTGEAEVREPIEARRRAAVDDFIAAGLVPRRGRYYLKGYELSKLGSR